MTQENLRTAVHTDHIPETSYWPIFLAAALTLTMAGLVVHLALTLIGAALCLATMIAWSFQRFYGPSLKMEAPVEQLHLQALSEGQTNIEMAADVRRGSGWWGLVWFITSEAIFFLNLIVAYLYLRMSNHTWPPPGIPHRELLFPSINTVVLLLSGLPALYAQRAIKRDDRRGLQTGLILAAILGVLFLLGQGYEYLTLGMAPQDNAFAASFFMLTGFHGAHVVAGVGLLLFVFLQSLLGRFSARRTFAVEVAGTYWHFVDIVWIFLFTALYLFQ